MKIHYSVWLSAIVLISFCAGFAWYNPVEFFKMLIFTAVSVSFIRIIYWFIERK